MAPVRRQYDPVVRSPVARSPNDTDRVSPCCFLQWTAGEDGGCEYDAYRAADTAEGDDDGLDGGVYVFGRWTAGVGWDCAGVGENVHEEEDGDVGPSGLATEKTVGRGVGHCDDR